MIDVLPAPHPETKSLIIEVVTLSQMLGLCSHDFLWPRRAADGDYYQVCRLCGVEHKYDWEHMRRKRSHPRPKPAPVNASSKRSPDRKTAPRLKLLLEPEPAYRVFFGNLADLIRRQPESVTTSGTADFWPDVFVPPVPLPRLLESMLFHTIAITVLVILSQPWVQLDPLPRVVHRSYISYYSPSKTFPALRGSQTPLHKPLRRRRETTPQAPGQNAGQTAAQKTIKVAPERVAGDINAPDLRLPNIKLPGSARPNIVASNLVPPPAPLSGIRRSQLTLSTGPGSIVAPPPEIGQGTSRRSGLPQASVVAPAPEVGGVSSRSSFAAPAAGVIAPPPVLQASIRRAGDLSIGPSAVVAPAPRLPTDAQSLGSALGQGGLATLAGSVAIAVPPPPSVQHSGTFADGRISGLPGGSLPIVPPPPSVLDAGNSGGGRGAGSMSGVGLQPVPPAPAVQEPGNSLGGGRGNLLAGVGSQVVPPAPGMQQAGSSFGNGRAAPLAGSGVQGVQPAPSASNGIGGGGRQIAMNIRPEISPAAPPPAKTVNPPEPASEEVPVRVIGLALSLEHSSYFSNYEVFIAERGRRTQQPELIKLVYESLPYQRRLSEYGVDNTKVYRLRVSRDKSCDESLLQMTWPENDPHPDAHNTADAPGLSNNDRHDMLPCYRTTADDYRRAISSR